MTKKPTVVETAETQHIIPSDTTPDNLDPKLAEAARKTVKMFNDLGDQCHLVSKDTEFSGEEKHYSKQGEENQHKSERYDTPQAYTFVYDNTSPADEKCMFCQMTSAGLIKQTFDDSDGHNQVEAFAKKLRMYHTDIKKSPIDNIRYTQKKDSDPANDYNYTHILTRYVHAIVKQEYPDGRKFTVRGFYYRVLSANYCWVRFRNNIATIYKLKANHETYQTLSKYLRYARYGGLIQYNQISEGRSSDKVDPIDNQFTPKTDIIYNINPNLDLGLHIDKPMINGPLILIYTEKSTYEYALKEIAEKYHIAYYIGNGIASVTSSHLIYEYIKKYANVGIVLTLTDFDKEGLEMPVSLFRKIQHIASMDTSDKKDKPIILVDTWIMGEKEALECRKFGIVPMIKDSKKKISKFLADGKTKKTPEQIAEERSKNDIKTYEIDTLEAFKGFGDYVDDDTLTKVLIRKLRFTLNEKFFCNFEKYRKDEINTMYNEQLSSEFVNKIIGVWKSNKIPIPNKKITNMADIDTLIRNDIMTHSPMYKTIVDHFNSVAADKIHPVILKDVDMSKLSFDERIKEHWTENLDKRIMKLSGIIPQDIDIFNKSTSVSDNQSLPPNTDLFQKIGGSGNSVIGKNRPDYTYIDPNDPKKLITINPNLIINPYEATTRWLNKLYNQMALKINSEYEDKLIDMARRLYNMEQQSKVGTTDYNKLQTEYNILNEKAIAENYKKMKKEIE